jgi:hypothetical protein
MKTEAFLINPIECVRSAKAGPRRNPIGELLIVGTNPKFKGVTMRHRRHRKRAHHNPRRRRHARYMMVGNKYSHNPRRRHYRRVRHNPIFAMAGTSMKHLLPMVLSVTSGVIAVDALPLVLSRFIPAAGTGIMNYAAKAGAIVGGGMIAKKVGGRDAQVAFIAGGVGKVLLDLVGNTVVSMIASVAPAAPTAAASTAGYGAIMDRGRLGAIEDRSMGALYDEESPF